MQKRKFTWRTLLRTQSGKIWRIGFIATDMRDFMMTCSSVSANSGTLRDKISSQTLAQSRTQIDSVGTRREANRNRWFWSKIKPALRDSERGPRALPSMRDQIRTALVVKHEGRRKRRGEEQAGNFPAPD